MIKNLAQLTRKDLEGAKTSGNNVNQVCPAGTHLAKVVRFVEEETYQFIELTIDGVNYRFFYNLFLRDSDALDADVLNWIQALATIPVTDTTSFLEITNSSIGFTYEIETRTYVSKTGKNAGKEQHAIKFTTLPQLSTTNVEEENLDINITELPF